MKQRWEHRNKKGLWGGHGPNGLVAVAVNFGFL